MAHFIKSWNNKTIRIREDRYVSLTDMAQATETNVGHWLENKGTHSYLKALSSRVGIPTMAQNQGFPALVEVKKGGDVTKSGTWGYPKVAIAFARWCNDDFAVQMDFWIDELMTTGKVELVPTEPPKKNIYGERVRLMYANFKNIPKNHWCILHESANLLIWIEEVMGYPVNRGDIVDISIGKRWATYREGKPWAKPRYQGYYTFPNGKGVPPWTYHFDELPFFKVFLEDLYKPKFLPQYLEKTYGKLAN